MHGYRKVIINLQMKTRNLCYFGIKYHLNYLNICKPFIRLLQRIIQGKSAYLFI